MSSIRNPESNTEEIYSKSSARPGSRKERKVRNYDFKRALRFSKDQVRGLTRVHENFARLLTTQLSAQLRTFVEIHVSRVDQIPYEDFIRSLPEKTILTVFEPVPLEGRMLMEVNLPIAYSMLDRLLGGSGEEASESEGLTEIETKIMTRIISRALNAFREAWHSVEPFQPEMNELEQNPQFIQLVSPNETVVVISLEATIGEVTGPINLCLPYVVIEHLLPKLSVHMWMQTKQKERPLHEEDSIRETIKNAALDITVELGKTDVTVQELLNLQKGDVVRLGSRVTDPLLVNVESELRFKAQPGKQKQKLAVQITEEVEEADSYE
ncbi:flagellar motor switch protein FliM [Alteribacter natronophilus]|uniref:flagellar motor switch protein FliM n=1 Tax=Alteribacter natronophilus TaxID=2583810 RepID=UPI001FE472C9|nr:flagellar motor switch protein FliM [Alteribacter natronophilus]